MGQLRNHMICSTNKKTEVLKHAVFSLVHRKPAKILLAQTLKVFLTPCFGNSRFLNIQGFESSRYFKILGFSETQGFSKLRIF